MSTLLGYMFSVLGRQLKVGANLFSHWTDKTLLVYVSFEFTHSRCFYSVMEVSMSYQLVCMHKVEFISWVITSNCCQTAKWVNAKCFVLACICLCCTVGLSIWLVIWLLSERHVEAYVFICVEYYCVVKLVKCVNIYTWNWWSFLCT